jgi:tRNA pseudouridine55 synthase
MPDLPLTLAEEPAGVFNIDKPAGLSSHDVVNRVRRLLGIRRVGHAGTLDPLATGVLLVCVGVATRIVEYLQVGRKVYQADLVLGATTTTYDAEGEVVSTAPLPPLTVSALEAALQPFRGEIWQRPPAFSAVKHRGRPLYALARAGIEVESEPRRVTIYQMEVLDWQPPHLTLRITCSPGTYIRSLAHDIGRHLGCGAYLHGLRRLASGTWRVEDAVRLEDLMAAGACWQPYLHGLPAALAMLPPVVLGTAEAARFIRGQVVLLPAVQVPVTIPAQEDMAVFADLCRVFVLPERLLGIGRIERTAEGILLHPHKVLRQRLETDPSAAKVV